MHQRGLSTRRSCALCSISLSSSSYRPSIEKQHNDQVLGQRLHEVARVHEDYGYRRAHQHLRNQQEVVNHKRVQPGALWADGSLRD
jgi:hypothetical protein